MVATSAAPTVKPTKAPVDQSNESEEEKEKDKEEEEKEKELEKEIIDHPEMKGCVPGMAPWVPCSAVCDQVDNEAYVAEGNQTWIDRCTQAIESRFCHIPCSGMTLARGEPSCFDKAWSECPRAGVQSKLVAVRSADLRHRHRRLDLSTQQHSHVHSHAHANAHSSTHLHRRNLEGDIASSVTSSTSDSTVSGGEVEVKASVTKSCKYRQLTRTCYTGSVPVDDGDYLVFIDMRVRVDPWHWSFVHAEAFYGAFSSLFSVSIFILNKTCL